MLSVHLTQELEKVKEDSGEGGAIADPPAAPTPEVNQQMSDDRCELQRGCCFTFTLQIFFFSKRFYLFTFRQRGREGERKGKKHQCGVVS